MVSTAVIIIIQGAFVRLPVAVDTTKVTYTAKLHTVKAVNKWDKLSFNKVSMPSVIAKSL